MREYSAFDILGPIMIGPSSSHTAGAARLGKVARNIANHGFESVIFHLHGSFAKTYRGHGTDKALLAGVLGMEPWDERLKVSFDIAARKGLKVEFIETDLGYEHPNTVKIVFHYLDGREVQITGSSIGGGNIVITKINGHNVEITSEYPTLFVTHNDRYGTVSRVTGTLSRGHINIATMNVSRKSRGEEACMVIQTDSEVSEEIIEEILNIPEVISARVIN